MEIFVKAVSLIMSLSILVLLHELGHFIPARLFKTRVEKFYLFFDPWFSLFKFKKGDTEYGIGWIPLGGYVKISGMIDESMDKEAMKEEPKAYEFRSKPAWQRLIIMVGGVTVNALLAWFIYIMILFVWGKEELPLDNVTYNLEPNTVMKKYGFRSGDKVVNVDGVRPYEVQDISHEIMLNAKRKVTVERDGKQITLTLPEDVDQEVLAADEVALFEVRVPFLIDSIIQDTAFTAMKSSLKEQDQVIALNGKPTPFYQDFKNEVKKHSGKTVQFTVLRGKDTSIVSCAVSSEGLIGVQAANETKFFTTVHREYSFLEAIPGGINLASEKLVGYVKQFKLVFTPEGANKVGGPVSMGRLFPSSYGEHYWEAFWNLTALLSVILAFMNILPIPALDGGHVMFLLYEIIFRKKPGDKFMEYAQMTGMILLLGLMAFAFFNDFRNFVWNLF
ncbi:MAG: RIP metalloprotease RseP [Flavobacteriales bacterium]